MRRAGEGEDRRETTPASHSSAARSLAQSVGTIAAGDGVKGQTFTISNPAAPALGREVCVFVSQQYPPAALGGIGRNIHGLARSVAALGHHVHVVTRGQERDDISFEEGVWVHRKAPIEPTRAPPFAIPQHSWSHHLTVLAALEDIAERQIVTAVHAPIWDSEGLAVLLDRRFPLVLGLQTPLKFWLDHHSILSSDEAFYGEYADALIACETLLLKEADLIHANSNAIADDISAAYGVAFEKDRLVVTPHTVTDWTTLKYFPPLPSEPGSIRILFVGRLEWRKGIDVLLDVVPWLLDAFEHVHFDIVGDDSIVSENGKTYCARFEAEHKAKYRGRVVFHGVVSEFELRGFYRDCHIFVAPSRYESFGMILVEAMSFAKACIASRTGGMVDIVVDGETGLLAQPGSPDSLSAVLTTLICNPILVEAFGRAGRDRYVEKFSSVAISASIVESMRCARQRHEVA